MSADRPLPTLKGVAKAQLRLLLCRRPHGVLIAAAIVLLQIVAVAWNGIIFGVQIRSDHATGTTTMMWSRVSDFADELEFPVDEGVAAAAIVGIAAAFWAFFWPFRVWGEERPQTRGYHWSMPVDRRRHDLLRVGVGAAVLVAIVAGFLLLAWVTALAAGHAGTIARYPALPWLTILAAPLIIYLLASIPVVGSRHPAAWLWGTLGACALLLNLVQVLDVGQLQGLAGELLIGRLGLLSTLGGPVVGQIAGWPPVGAAGWLAAWVLWLAVAATAVVLAASRRSPSI